jgi:hypothetical protein
MAVQTAMSSFSQGVKELQMLTVILERATMPVGQTTMQCPQSRDFFGKCHEPLHSLQYMTHSTTTSDVCFWDIITKKLSQ